jgi:hypothetical protein
MKMFETESCHNEDFSVPENNELVSHSVYGDCYVLSNTDANQTLMITVVVDGEPIDVSLTQIRRYS